MDLNSSNQERYLKLPQVLAIVPVSRSTWYRGIQQGIYPRAVKVSHRASAWRLSDVNRSIENLQGRFESR